MTGPTATGAPTREDAEQRFAADVEAHLPRNYAAHLLHGMLGQTGFRIVMAPTFVPAYVFLLAGSDWAVGVARACLSLGMLLSPLIGASLIEHKRRVLPTALRVGFLMRAQILGMALSGFFLPDKLTVAALCLFLFLLGFFNGIQLVLWNVLVAKVIPLSRRGALVGMRSFLGGLTASSVGIAGGYFIEHNVLGDGYASLFLTSFGLTASGLFLLLVMREPDAPSVRPAMALRERLHDVPRLLREHTLYRRYFAARACGVLSTLAAPYYVIYASETLHLSGGAIGTLTGAFLISQSITDLLWGRVGDKRGFRLVLLLSLGLLAGATTTLTLTTSFAGVVAIFAALGTASGGFIMSTQTLVLELGSREELPLRIAVAQTGEQLAGVVAPLFGGLLASTLGYRAVFGVSVVVALVALAITAFALPEPRTRTA